MAYTEKEVRDTYRSLNKKNQEQLSVYLGIMVQTQQNATEEKKEKEKP